MKLLAAILLLLVGAAAGYYIGNSGSTTTTPIVLDTNYDDISINSGREMVSSFASNKCNITSKGTSFQLEKMQGFINKILQVTADTAQIQNLYLNFYYGQKTDTTVTLIVVPAILQSGELKEFNKKDNSDSTNPFKIVSDSESALKLMNKGNAIPPPHSGLLYNF